MAQNDCKDTVTMSGWKTHHVGTTMKDRSFFHLALLRHQNIKTSLNFLKENHWARPFFALFSSVREKLQLTVSLNHPVLYTWVLKVNNMEFWISDVALWSGCGGDEFECKYPAFTGISREIRCDLGEGDKARGGKLVAGGVFSLYYPFGKKEYFHYIYLNYKQRF